MLKKLFKSYSYKALQIVVLTWYSLVLLPVLLHYWDLSVFGGWIAIYSFYNLIQVLELGHSRFVGNEFNRLVHSSKQKAKDVLGSAMRVNFVVELIQLLLVYLVYQLGLLRYFLDSAIDDKEVATVLGILFLYRFCIGSYRGIVVKTLNPFGLIYKSFQFSLIEKILEFFILLVAAMSGLSLVELALLWFVVKLSFSVIVLYEMKRILPDYYPWWKYGSFNLGIQNFWKSTSFAMSNFMDRLRQDGVVLLVSALVGTTYLPLFSATRTLVNFGVKLSDLVLRPIVPEMINLFAKKKFDKILDIFKAYWFLTGVILIAVYTLSLFFMDHFFRIWTNDKLTFSELLYGALAIIYLIQNYGEVMITFFSGINKTRIVLQTAIIRVVIFLGVTFTWPNPGLLAILNGLFVAELFIASIWLPYHSFKIFDLSTKEKFNFYLNLICVLWLGVMFYFKQDGKPLLLLSLLFIPIIFLLKFQLSLISMSTRDLFQRYFPNIFRAKL